MSAVSVMVPMSLKYTVGPVPIRSGASSNSWMLPPRVALVDAIRIRSPVRTLPDARIDGPAVAVLSRLVITGGDHHRLHEELTEAGGYLRETGFRREDRVTELRGWLDTLHGRALKGVTVAAFDTRVGWPKLLSGSAADQIAKRLKSLDFTCVRFTIEPVKAILVFETCNSKIRASSTCNRSAAAWNWKKSAT